MSSDPHEQRHLGPEHARLSVFVGRWQVSGENEPAAPDSPRLHVSGEESYEWLTGGFFLVNRWDRTFGDHQGRHTGTGVIGVNEHGSGYVTHAFDNLGYHREYQVQNHDRVWTYRGTHERAEFRFDSDWLSFEVTWEMTADGSVWKPLCRLRASKKL